MSLPPLRTTSSNGRTFSWRESGTGQTLVLLHGIGGGAGSWSHQFGAFAGRYRVVAWNAPGYGQSSDLATETPGADDYVAALVAFLDALGIDDLVLCGQSLGGIMAAHFAARHAGRVRKLILVACARGHGAEPEAEREAKYRARIETLAAHGPAGMADRRARTLVAAGSSETALAQVRAVMAEINPHGYTQAAAMLREADVTGVLPAIRAPTLVICGAADTVTPPETNRAIAAAIAGARFETIPDVGHALYAERPDLFNALIAQFLA